MSLERGVGEDSGAMTGTTTKTLPVVTTENRSARGPFLVVCEHASNHFPAAFGTLGLMPANRHIVLNFSDRMAGLTPRDAAAIIGTPIDIEVPRSPAVVLASNRGRPLIHDDPRDPAAKGLREVVARIARDEMPKRSRLTRRGRVLEPQ